MDKIKPEELEDSDIETSDSDESIDISTPETDDTQHIEDHKDARPEEDISEKIEEQRDLLAEIPDTQPENIKREVPTGKNKLVEILERTATKGFRINVEGEENLAKISDEENVVITTTHITDSDMVIAMAGIGKATSQNQRFGQTKMVQMIGNFDNKFFSWVVKNTGSENWLKIDVKGSGSERINKFTPEDFVAIKESLEEGFPIAIAESLDPYSDGWSLSVKTGNGAARLLLDGCTILPVAVEIDEKLPMKPKFWDQVLLLWKLAKRPKAKVIIGEPIRSDRGCDTSKLDKIIEKRKSGQKITQEDRENFRIIKEEIQSNSEKIKKEIAKLLPPDRRGKW